MTSSKIIPSQVVPTEYDMTIGPPGIVTLTDDRGRRFSGFGRNRALAAAEDAQDPNGHAGQ